MDEKVKKTLTSQIKKKSMGEILNGALKHNKQHNKIKMGRDEEKFFLLTFSFSSLFLFLSNTLQRNGDASRFVKNLLFFISVF